MTSGQLQLVQKFTGHKRAVYGLFYDTEKEVLISAGGEGWLVEWSDHGTGKLLAEVGDQIFSLTCLPQKNSYAVGTMSGDLYFIESSKPRRKIFHSKGIYDLLSVSQYMCSAGGDGKLGLWDMHTTELVESLVLSHERLRSLALSPDGQLLAIGASDGHIYLVDTIQWNLQKIIHQAHLLSVFTVCWLDNDYLVSGGRDAHIRVWKMDDLSGPDFSISAHWYTVNHLIFDRDKHLISASRDKTIRVWETKEWKLIKSLDATKSGGHIHSVNRLAIGPHGGHIYAASDDTSISVWKWI